MRSDRQDAFQYLGVSPTASALEVKRAYRRLVATWHPDRYAQDPVRQRLAQERLKEINGAYAECLQQIGQRRSEGAKPPAAAPVPKAATPRPAAASRAESAAVSPRSPALPQWPNLALAAVLAVGGVVALRRYGLTGAFLQYLGLLAIVPGVAAFWYNARLLRGRVMLILYLLAVAGTGLFLVLNQALYEQRLIATVPAWQGGGEVSRGVNAGGRGADPGEFSLSPPAAIDRGFGPTVPLAPAPAAPLAPLAPLAPAAPVAPRAK